MSHWNREVETTTGASWPDRALAAEAEVARLTAELAEARKDRAENSFGWEHAESLVNSAPITWIPSLFIAIVRRSREAWVSREAMLTMAGKAWDAK